MGQKYWVPAIEKASRVVDMIARNPSAMKLMELSSRLEINKSSMFSLLHTMEALGWITRSSNDTYCLGPALGVIGNAYIQSLDLVELFHKEARLAKDSIGETIQLARLEGNEVFYLAKETAPSLVRIMSDPGMRYPAYATALGKALLAELPDHELIALYPDDVLPAFTPFTITTTTELLSQIQQIRQDGFAYDLQESVIGFCCVAMAICDKSGEPLAAVSCSIPQYYWEQKKDGAFHEINELVKRLSAYY